MSRSMADRMLSEALCSACAGMHLLLLAGLPGLACAAQPSAPAAITLEVDSRDIQHGIQHAHETMPAAPGEMRVVYPKWVQGEHAAAGPIVQLTGLRFSAGDRSLAWTRDPLDAYRFRVTVPDGVATIGADFDYLSPPVRFADNYGGTPNVTPHMALVLFNHVMLLPESADIRTQPVRARVRIPDGWTYDAANRGDRPEPGLVVLPEMSAATLVDSPLFAGEFSRRIELTTRAPATRLSIFADAAADLAIKDDALAGLRRVVAEADALFGAHHYRRYAWLVALGDTLEVNGLEHHESTDIRMKEALFTKPEFMQRWASVFPHEYVHSWNGKYRRPQGLTRNDFQEALQDTLLWVYEGMTRYLGDFVLRGRAGFDAPEFMRDYLADLAATQESLRPGRSWRPLADTAVGVPAFSSAPDEWTGERRAFDYYPEGALIWLEADTIIRTRSGGRRSLDDFCRRFFGGEDGALAVVAYTRADVIAALDAVQPYDWDAFLRTRIDEVQPHAPLGGIVNGGWSLTRSDEPNAYRDALTKVNEVDDFSYSLGFAAKHDGKVADVVYGSPAFTAGLAPATQLIAIGGRKWSADAAKEVIRAAEKAGAPIDLIVESGDTVRTLHVDWHGGLAFPHLVRDSSKPDLISKIIARRSNADR
jgi:predicted metalloprotease with PDZ domain